MNGPNPVFATGEIMRISLLLGATALAGSLFTSSVAAQSIPNVPSATPPTATTPGKSTAPGDPTEQAVTVSADGEQRDDGSIIVTGSRIARPEINGVLPGVQITAQSIETRGFTNALEALNDIPLVGPGASPLNGNNGGQTASLGAAFVDLLDLGTARTLTLVNGRRFVSGNAASLFVAGNETGSQVDINVIPTSLIERVDTVTVGGAAAYGADAIAGVVNFILKDDYDGLQLRGLTGISERGDAAQYQLSALAGHNFLDGRANITASFEYSRNDGLQATSRDFRTIRPGSYTNPFNGGVRNPNFAPTAIIDVANANNGAFLRAADDGQPSTLFGLGLVTQTLSNPGTVLNVQGTSFYTPYTRITGTNVAGQAVTTNYIALANGVAPVGFALAGTTANGAASTLRVSGTGASINNGFFSFSGAQIIQGTPGAGAITANGLNGRTTQATNVPFTTFAPTSLPANVTAAQIFTAYGVTAPTGATAAQQTLLAVNLLQANRFTAREFLAANPTTNLNYFIGTFAPDVPRIANTDTTLVSVKVNGTTVQVPVNQVLPFVAVPLEFNDNGTLRAYTFSGPVSGNDPLTVSSARGGDGGFRRSLENTVLRTQQDRYVANLLGKFDISDQVTFFTENTYAKVLNRSLGNISGAQNFITQGQENAALLVNYNNPYLTAQNRAVLTSVGITPTATNQGNFLITRQNQDVFGANPYTNRQETYRLVGGLRSKFELLGHRWNAEISGSYGRSVQTTKSANISDIEYQLALDAVDQGLATTGVANGNVVCRAQVFPTQYLGRTPVGTAQNITRVRGADGVLTEVLLTPTISQAQIDGCRPLNPFGYNNMTDASKAYVIGQSTFRNVSEQTYAQASIGGGLFNLPAGTVQINVNGEYRRDKLGFSTNELNTLGRTRSAPSSDTEAYTETYEIGGEMVIPLTGPNFLPFLGRLDFQPAVRISQQNGRAQSYRNLTGQLTTPQRNGDAATIFSLAGTWAPTRDIQFRGNYTRSVRQPSIVELFLGGQPSFTTPVDLCNPANIDSGSFVANRRKNCTAAVIAAGVSDAQGVITTTDRATSFLQNYVATGAGLQGVFNGNTALNPERGESWTAGAALTPRWIPGLTISADYIDVRVKDVITTASIGTFLQTCYDSPIYPNPTADVGINSCTQFSRGTDFQLQNGYSAGFLNLGGQRVKAVNASANYTIELGSDRLTLRGGAYRLISYQVSPSGRYDDTQESVGSFGRPRWETQLSARYEHNQVYGQATWNRSDPTRIFVSNLPATNEQYPYTRYAAQNNVDMTLGVDVSESFRFQVLVANVLDNTTAGDLGYRFADYYDQIGRRYRMTVTTRF